MSLILSKCRKATSASLLSLSLASSSLLSLSGVIVIIRIIIIGVIMLDRTTIGKMLGGVSLMRHGDESIESSHTTLRVSIA
jgi:hypothetical protein